MATQNLSEHVLLITLPTEPQTSTELTAAAGSTTNRDVIVNLSLVETLPPAIISGLTTLDRLLGAAGRQLILCSVPLEIMDAFRRAGVRDLFRFADDKFAALQSLENDAGADS